MAVSDAAAVCALSAPAEEDCAAAADEVAEVVRPPAALGPWAPSRASLPGGASTPQASGLASPMRR
eukprot:15294366-Alexandrium_andersonii.AAC.1